MDPRAPLLSEQDAAKLLGVKAATLQRWRIENRTELPYIKIRYLIRYRLSDVLEFLERNRVGRVAQK